LSRIIDPTVVIDHVTPALKQGSFLITVCPNMTQVIQFCDAIRYKLPYITERIVEIEHREWEVRSLVSHPAFRPLGHTAFIVQVRKIQFKKSNDNLEEVHKENKDTEDDRDTINDTINQ